MRKLHRVAHGMNRLTNGDAERLKRAPRAFVIGMKRLFLSAAIVVLVAAAVDASGPGSRRNSPAVGVPPAPRAAHGRRPVMRSYVYPQYYWYGPYGYYHAYPPLVVSPDGAYYPPPTIVVTHPYFCTLHQAGWVSRAGFLDHVAGAHKLPLESAARFCPDGVESCLFPAY